MGNTNAEKDLDILNEKDELKRKLKIYSDVIKLLDKNNDNKIDNVDYPYNEQSLQSEKKKTLLMAESKDSKLETFIDNNKCINRILNNYADNNVKRLTTNRKMKICFFWIILAVFLTVIASSIVLVFYTIRKTEWQYIATTVTALIGMITSILCLPKLICDYLFPKGEDGFIAELIKYVQNDNLEHEKLKQKNKDSK